MAKTTRGSKEHDGRGTAKRAKAVLAELEALGTAQTRKIYGRHGVSGEMFGVSYADLGKLTKKLGPDQPLADALWNAKNHDARVLACMVADPESVRSSTLDAWLKDLDSYPLAGAFSTLVAATPFAASKLKRWTRSNREFVGQVGWSLVASAALSDDPPADDYFVPLLEEVEEKIHGSKDRVSYAMNNALIAIALRNSKLERLAVAAARRIGAVEVDHGETSCKTPDAIAYIRKAKEHRKKQAKKLAKREAAKKQTPSLTRGSG